MSRITVAHRGILRLTVPLVALLLGAGTAVAQAEPGPIAVRGRVLPLSGASAPPSSVTIEMRPALPGFEARKAALDGLEPPAIVSVRAVADGSFAITAPAPGVYRISFRARGFRAMEIPLLPVVEPVELPPVAPAGLRPLSVTVLDPKGRPVGGAVVRAVSLAPADESNDPGGWRPATESVRTDSQGRAIVGRSVGETVQIQVETADGAGFSEVEADAPWAEVRLQPRVTIALVVRDASGRPPAGALVLAAGRAIAALDSEGRAEVLPLAPGSPPLLVLAKDGSWAELTSAQAGDEGGKMVTLRLGAPRKARGRALESITGKPLTGGLVWAAGEGISLDGWRQPDAKGSFEIALAGSGRPTFGAAAAGHASRQLVAPVPGPREAPVILHLDPVADPGGAGLTGVLRDEAGRPIGGAEIFAIRETRTQNGTETTTRGTEQRLATSDIHGGFHAGGLEAGTFDLVARANGFVPGRLPNLTLAPGGRLPDLQMVLSRGLRIEGILRDPEGNPASGATVEARRVGPTGQVAAMDRFRPPQSSSVTDRGGHFKLTGLEPGTYEVTAENALGRARGTIEVKADGGRIELRLAK